MKLKSDNVGAYRYDNNEWLYTAAYKYGSSSNIKDTNLGSAHLRHTWHIQDPVAYELFTQTGLDIRLSKNLSLDIDFNLVHDTGLPEDVKPTDTDYMTGFSYSY